MNEGWQNDDYLIVLTQDESLAAMKAYREAVGLRGDPTDKTNVAWITHEQHAELVVWWNEQYKRAGAQPFSD
ncbi:MULTISPECIES: hypothetical protein [Pseudomonas fluorescens group]|uniref:Uncharacterized protein n=1 Tax=Pseudomonas fluorescens TaxID=294 RepID=A0ACD4XKK4_PSEFL|nr:MULTISPECIES: hypothetical protein [Pseudomonas fluorescens group]KJZ51346.1 hypothetical protein VC37_23700 [Pseudomonas marginalis]KJZ54837.1 hypothetical protein VC36_24245 [Pseudomonas marginalis]MBZ6457206.1 hypothetical protein [Pseudomonas fluorescens group sp.]MBZ6460407.1 hypothetical protein [Pseudomonas fluorescens group sp.]MBZ6466049.1 hypothetical protein [Pseudomonas fluorescens group sp.]